VDEVAGATGIEADAVRAHSREVKADTAANKEPVPQLVSEARRRGGEAPDILAERSARAFVAVQRDGSNLGAGERSFPVHFGGHSELAARREASAEPPRRGVRNLERG